MAYAVGLMATDGCLVNTGRHLSFDSGDPDLVETFLRCIGRPIRYREIRTRSGGVVYKALFGDVVWYRWLESVGLHQRKSLTLGAIDVPDDHLLSLVRGLLDGDGSVCTFVHRPTRALYPNYEYERLWVFFASASRAHLEWLRESLRGTLGLNGYLSQAKRREGHHDFFQLKYGKHESIKLLSALYVDPAAPRLERKWMKWEDYRRRNLCAEGGT